MAFVTFSPEKSMVVMEKVTGGKIRPALIERKKYTNYRCNSPQ
jgi:hypothetical protein